MLVTSFPGVGEDAVLDAVSLLGGGRAWGDAFLSTEGI